MLIYFAQFYPVHCGLVIRGLVVSSMKLSVINVTSLTFKIVNLIHKHLRNLFSYVTCSVIIDVLTLLWQIFVKFNYATNKLIFLCMICLYCYHFTFSALHIDHSSLLTSYQSNLVEYEHSNNVPVADK